MIASLNSSILMTLMVFEVVLMLIVVVLLKNGMVVFIGDRQIIKELKYF